MKYKVRDKIWFTQPGKEKLPAIIKNIDGNVYSVYVFYDGFWQDDVARLDMIEPRTDNLSDYLFNLRKHML